MSRREIDLSSVDARPETKFVMSGETSIAYQVFGRGDQDLLYVPGIISHLEAQWDDPEAKGFLLDLSRHYRVIMIDKRGQGMSDRIDGATTLEERIDDLRAVMEATASTVVNIFAISEGGPVSLLFAATYPERVKRLILFAQWQSSGVVRTTLTWHQSNRCNKASTPSPQIGVEVTLLSVLVQFQQRRLEDPCSLALNAWRVHRLQSESFSLHRTAWQCAPAAI